MGVKLPPVQPKKIQKDLHGKPVIRWIVSKRKNDSELRLWRLKEYKEDRYMKLTLEDFTGFERLTPEQKIKFWNSRFK